MVLKGILTKINQILAPDDSCYFSERCSRAWKDENCDDFILAYHHCSGFKLFRDLEEMQIVKQEKKE